MPRERCDKTENISAAPYIRKELLNYNALNFYQLNAIVIIVIMIGFAVRILGNSLAFYVANLLVPGFVVNGGIKEYLIAGILLGFLNLLVKPLLKLVAMPLIVLSLGLFSFIINGLILWAIDYIFDFITIENLMALFWTVVIIGIVNIIASVSAKIID